MIYGSFEELQEKLLYKKIKSWNSDVLILEDGTVITIEMSESDCCARAGGEFDVLHLDAVITHIALTDKRSQKDDWAGETTNYVTVVLLHNQNEIARANCFADDGNGGYYYSVCSLVVTGVHYPVVRA